MLNIKFNIKNTKLISILTAFTSTRTAAAAKFSPEHVHEQEKLFLLTLQFNVKDE